MGSIDDLHRRQSGAGVAGMFGGAAVLAALVLGEMVVLWLNRWSCPLTAVAARYTDDPPANFDIYLPKWLARYNKQIFGPLYVAGLMFSSVPSIHRDRASALAGGLGVVRARRTRGNAR
jgi:hypothetical protein